MINQTRGRRKSLLAQARREDQLRIVLLVRHDSRTRSMADRHNLFRLLMGGRVGRLAHALRRVAEETGALRGNLVEKALR